MQREHMPFYCTVRPVIRAVMHVAVWLILMAAAPCAQAQDYGWFSLDPPRGWQAEAPSTMAGAWILSLTGPEETVHARIMVGKTAGPPDAADVAGLLRAAAGVREPLRRADAQYVFRGKDALGVDTACIVGADPQAGLYMAVLCSGEVDRAEELLAALRAGSNPAMLPQRHTVRGGIEPRFLPAAQ